MLVTVVTNHNSLQILVLAEIKSTKKDTIAFFIINTNLRYLFRVITNQIAGFSL